MLVENDFPQKLKSNQIATMWTDLDKEMKAFEAAYDLKVPADAPFMIRLDGVRFSKYTKQLFFKEDETSPFSMTFADVMKKTATALLLQFNPIAVYTSSDEITMVFAEIPEEKLAFSSVIYGGRVQKLASVTAAFATAAFNECLFHVFPQRELASFDARVFSMPDRQIVIKNIKWRAAADAARNSYQKLAQFHIGKRIQKLTKEDVRQILHQKNVDWERLDPHLKYGSIIKKRTVLKLCCDYLTNESHEARRTETFITPLSRESLSDQDGLMHFIFT